MEDTMSRSGYCEDMDDQWSLIRWRGAVASAIRGKRGQALLRDMIAALEAMPKKELVANELECADGICALGAVGRARGIDMAEIDPEDSATVSGRFDIAEPLALEIVYENDETPGQTPATRFSHMLAWAKSHLRKETPR
jgi:hypothetical protein